IVIGGTKCPSMTSTWISRAPAAITSATWAPSREKSAERIDGATRRPPNRSRAVVAAGALSVLASIAPELHGPEHRVTAMLAEEVLGGAHSNYRLVLPALRALRDQLVAAQAVDAPIPARKLGGPQPRLAAARAGRTLDRRASPLPAHRRRSRAMKNPSVRSRSGIVWRKRESRADASGGCAAPRSSACILGSAEGSAPIRSSFSH